jgi:hypothetical protein
VFKNVSSADSGEKYLVPVVAAWRAIASIRSGLLFISIIFEITCST